MVTVNQRLWLLMLLALINTVLNAQMPDKRIVYISGGVDNTLNLTLLNDVFGEGNYEQFDYGSVDTTGLFSTNTCMIFVEGSYAANDDFIEFYDLYLDNFENYVSNGGYLYINFRSYPGFDYYLGFDSIYRINNVSSNYSGKYYTDNKLFYGPYFPISDPVDFSPELGFFMWLGDFAGVNYDTLIIDTTNSRVCLLQRTFGSGQVIVSQFYPNGEYYSEEHLDLRRNILWHLAPCLHAETDLGIQQVLYPGDACDLGEENMQVLVHNYGFNDQNNYQIHFQIDGGSVISETVTENIAAYLSDTVLLTTYADFSTCGDHEVKIWTTVEGDTVPQNDTLLVTITNICATPANLNYPSTLCETDPVFTPDVSVGSGGIFSGAGVTDSLTGTFDPTELTNGSYSIVNYSYATAIDYTLEAIPYDPPEIASPIFVSFTANDDVDTLPIGFNFNFYENTYNTIFPASNGYMCFGEAHDTWYIGIPDETINNLIALAGEDLNILSGGTVFYKTTGTAPYRKFIIKYDEVHLNFPFYLFITATAVLYETTGVIEIFIEYLPDVDEGGFVVGIDNDYGTDWIASNWFNGASDTAFRYNPTLCPAVETDTIYIGPFLALSSTPATGAGNNGTATAAVTHGGTPPFFFAWETGENTETIENLIPGFYTVTITDSLECVTTDSVEVTLVNSINDVPEDGFTIYPNPAGDYIFVDMGAEITSAALIIISPEGEILYEDRISTSTTQIQTTNFPKGIYYVLVKSEFRNYFSKFILQ